MLFILKPNNDLAYQAAMNAAKKRFAAVKKVPMEQVCTTELPRNGDYDRYELSVKQ